MSRPVVFYSPHQDDETLAMGASIEQHAIAGRQVHVVLLTDGAASRARAALAERGVNLSVPEFVAARDREFADACARLGVPAERVHDEREPDGRLTPERARAILRAYRERYPTAGHHGMSWLDAPGDHRVFGLALRELADEIPDRDARFYLHHQFWSTADLPAAYYEESEQRRARAAAAAYRLVEPAQGRYGIGALSVAEAFRAHQADPRSRFHGPPDDAPPVV